MKTEVMQPVVMAGPNSPKGQSRLPLNRSISVPAQGPSFAEQLANFNRDNLKSVETKVVYTDGRCEMVAINGDGSEVVRKRTLCELGYIGDLKEDLQVAEVLPGLIMGSQDVAHNIELLTKYGVTHILNVATLVVNLYPYKFAYKNIEVLDIPEASILPYFNEAFPFIEEGRKRGCVLVHCNAGVSRSASFVIGYLMRTQCMTYQTAYEHLKARRPATQPNPGFVRQLKSYEDTLRAEKLRLEKFLTRSPPMMEKKQAKYQKKAKSLCEGDLPSVKKQAEDKAESGTTDEKVKKQGFFKRLNSRLEKFRHSISESHSPKSPSECDSSPRESSHCSDISFSSTEHCSESEEDEEGKKNQPSGSQRERSSLPSRDRSWPTSTIGLPFVRCFNS